MSLTGRFSALVLSLLALVLVGFSTAMYVSARVYLHRQLRDRIDAALAVLAAAVEVHPGGVEWEPQERILPLGVGSGGERLRWLVTDGRGGRLDHSRNLDDADLTPAWAPRPGSAELPARLADRAGAMWQIGQRRIVPGAVAATGSIVAARSGEPAGEAAGPGLHPALVLTVAAPVGPMEGTLATLAWFLLALAGGIWLLAALLCRWLSRRALAPLTSLAASARGLDAADPGWSLEAAGTGDELDDLGRAFNELLARLQVAYERQRRFGGDAAHQLRTPLTVMIGQVEVALRRDRPAEEYRRVLGSVLGRARQLGEMVEALLFLVKVEGQASLPPAGPLDLGEWAAEFLAARAPSARAPVVLRRDEAAGALRVRAHAPLLAQAIENLLDNAAKHGRDGAEIVVALAREGDEAVLAIEDRGPGIDPDEIPHIFEPFYRSPGARRRGVPGVGLGLPLVRRIVLAFGGSIAARPAVPQGLRVEIRLPICAVPPDESRAETAVADANGVGPMASL